MSIRLCIAALFAVFALLARTPVFAEVIAIDDPAAEKIFAEAQAKAGFWKLVHFYESQTDQTYCGVASAAIILNSLDIESPPAPAIYPSRKFDQTNFFTEAVLAIKPPKYVHLSGLTLEELAAMIRTYGVSVDVHHAAPPMDLDGFRAIASAALADPKARVLINYHRKYVGQEGAGHHSPLAAYDAVTDRFLVLDVARYRLSPGWAPAADVWAAMNTEDSDAKANRGFLVIRGK